MSDVLLLVAVGMQALAVVYGLVLCGSSPRPRGPWVLLLGAMLSMLAWRLMMLSGATPPAFFNPLIAIWGSSCMVGTMFLFSREVRRRARAEAERDALLASERAARTEAERASRLKDEFLATLSHELRTPLAAILSWCGVVQLRRHDAAQVAQGMEIIERNARLQVRLVDDLLDVTRMRAGTIHLDIETVGLDVPVRAAVQAVLPAAEAKGVHLELACDDPPPRVRGDTGRLQQIAANLLVNAVKFTPPGRHVTVTVCARDGCARLVVRDEGIGIEPGFVPLLFEPFRQADSSATRRHGGLGLGLSIVANLLRLHGGDVAAESAGPGAGATFTVTLPLAGADPRLDLAGPPALPLPDLASGTALAGVRVLLVDDEDDVRTAVSALLEHAGATVQALDSGTHVEAALQAFHPDVLLLDIGMPHEDGYALMRRIRRLPTDRALVPAVSLTAHARNEDRARAIASGFQRHLAKPIDLPLLVSTVRELARSARVRRVPDALAP